MPERWPYSDSDDDLFAWAASWFLNPDQLCPTWMAETVFKELEKRHATGYGRFFLFVREHEVFELLHENMVDALANLLRDELLVLEVGAGNGLLSKFLRDKGVNAIATDNGSWKIKHLAPVRRMRYTTAIEKFNPSCVLCSWMMLGEDWTPVFRACPTVNRYVLIGETGGGCCGSAETWGDSRYDSDSDEWVSISGGFQKDGWTTYDWPADNLCRTDYPCEAWGDRGIARHSSAVVFERGTADVAQ